MPMGPGGDTGKTVLGLCCANVARLLRNDEFVKAGVGGRGQESAASSQRELAEILSGEARMKIRKSGYT